LISEDNSRGNAGIPFLKDVPIVGGLFSNQTLNGARRELIVLITPYVVNDTHDAESLTDAFRRSLGSWTGTVGAPIMVPRQTEPTVAPAPVPAGR